MDWRRIAFCIIFLVIGSQPIQASCIGSLPKAGKIKVCVLRSLSFGEVTSPRIGTSTLVVTPGSNRNLGRHVHDFSSSHGAVSAALVRVQGKPSSRFRLRFHPSSDIIEALSTDLGPSNEGVIGPNGEKEVNIGATIRLDKRTIGSLKKQFTVTAELLN